MAPKQDREAFTVGDLVWTKVGSYPFWPGQVMDPEKAPEKVKRTYKKGRLLVSFFGDNTHGCYMPAQLRNFEKHVQRYRQGVDASAKASSWRPSFKIAVEQAEELLARRQGKEPATAHCPLDFKVEDPVYDVEYGNVDFTVSDIYRPTRPADAENYDVSEAYNVLQQAARNIDCMPIIYSDSVLQPPHEESKGYNRSVPEVSYDDLHKAGRFLVWTNFRNLPKDVQKTVCKAESGWSPQAEIKAAEEAAKAAEKAKVSSTRKVSQKRRKTKEAESEDEPSDEDFEDGKKEKEELSEDDESPPQQPKARRSKTTKSKPKPEASEEDEKKPELLRDKDEEKVLDGAEGDFDVHNDVDGDVKEEDADEPPQVGKRGVTAASRGKGGRPKSAQGKGRKKGGSEPLGAELSGGATVKKQRASKGTGKRGRGGKAGGKGAGRKAGNKNDEVGHIDEHDYGDNDQEQGLGHQAIGSILSEPGTSLPWPEQVAVHAVKSETQLVEMSKPVLDEVPGLEEMAAQCGVQLIKGKVALKKILARLRQFSRGHHNAASILNPQNVAAMHKLSHAVRTMQTNYTYPDPAEGAAQCTRDEQVHAWRHKMHDDIRRWQQSCVDYKEMEEAGTLPEDAEPPPDDPPPSPPPEPDTEFMDASPPKVICLAQNVYVPMHAYRHLKCIQGDEWVLLRTLRAFWRSRGTVLPKLQDDNHPLELDVPELLKEVSRRGGFWCTCALQGDGSAMHKFEHMHSWQILVRSCWISEDKSDKGVSLPHAAAQLQSYYYTWLLPFERWIMHEYHACTATARVPAQLVRRLGFDRGADSALTHTVKFFCAAAQGTTGEGYTECVAGRHDLTLDDALGIFEAAMGPLLSNDAVRDLSRSFSSTFVAKLSSSGSSAAPTKPPTNPALAAHATLDDIIPPTCSGQPELANTLMHVAANEVATGAQVHADGADVSTLQSVLEPVKPVKRGSGSGEAPKQGGFVSESDEEAGGDSDEEEGRQKALDEPAKEHMHGPRWRRQRGRPSITARGRGGTSKRKREEPAPSPSMELSSDGADDVDEEEQPADSADAISEDEQPKKKRSKASKMTKKAPTPKSKAALKTTAAAPKSRKAGKARRGARKVATSKDNGENDGDNVENATGTELPGSMHSDPSGGVTLGARTAPSDSGAARSAQDHDSHASAQPDALGDGNAHTASIHGDNNTAENNSLEAKESQEAPEVTEPKPVNKFKRQVGANRGLKRDKDESSGGNRHWQDKPWCTQFDFDERYPKISESRIKQAAEKCRLTLVSHEYSTIAGSKSMVLYFATRAEADRAAKELPGVVRRLEQKPAAYSIDTAVIKYNEAQSRIRAAKEQRELQLNEPLATTAVAGSAPAGGAAGGSAAAATANAAAAAPQEQQQPQQQQVVILQAPNGFPAQGYVQGNPTMVLAPAGMQQQPTTEGGVPTMYTQAPTYVAPHSPTQVTTYPGSTQYVAMDPQAAAATAAAAQGMPVATGAPQVNAIPDVNMDDLQAILSAAGAQPPPSGGGLMAPPPEALDDSKRGEDAFLNTLESLRGA